METTTTTNTATELLTLTTEAVTEVKRLLANEPQMSGLRLEVKGGGCSGMSYGLGFDTEKDGDHVMETQGVKVYLDPKSAVYLKGTLIDFQGGLQGKGFVIKNPQAKGSCGCGQSFTV